MNKKTDESKTVLNMPLFNEFNEKDESKNTSPIFKKVEEKKIVPLNFKNNSTGNIRAFTNAAEDEALKGKPLYLDMTKMITVFTDDRNLTIIHNGTLGWSVAEKIDYVIDVWKDVHKK